VLIQVRGRYVHILMVASVLVVLISQIAVAKSLWNESGFFASLIFDKRAQKMGDLVTIIVLEKANASHQASTSSDKDSGVNAGPGLGLLDFIPLLRVNTNNNATAKGSTARGGRIEAQLTAKIVDITDAGNFLIRGEQKVIINDEAQIIVVSGIVRPEDIEKDNTVLSTYIADASIEYKGDGTVDAAQSTGILTKIFDWLF
jgi:flagellar L-ring protein precursor FlgH